MSENVKPFVPVPKGVAPANMTGPTRIVDATAPVIKGVHYHLFEGKRYDVDTFYEDLYWEEIKSVQGKPRHRVWRYGNDYDVCPFCAKNNDIVFNIQRMGVYMKCTWCNVTIPAPPQDIKDLGPEREEDFKAELVVDKDISVEEADEVIKRTGQVSPFPVIRKRERRRRVT